MFILRVFKIVNTQNYQCSKYDANLIEFLTHRIFYKIYYMSIS